MPGNYVEIDLWGLGLAAIFVALVVAVSRFLRLNLERSLGIAALRCYAQLTLLGLALIYLLRWNHPLLTGLVLGIMILFSVHTVLLRLKEIPFSLFKPVLIAMTTAGVAVTFVVIAVILRAQPLWEARLWLPIGGMVLGNSMNGIALSVERCFAELHSNRNQVEALLTLGATPAEASAGAVRSGMRAGLLPTINNMAVVGVVSIPGMMTGQVLAGADPQQAARYQIVVMLMIAAATALGAISAILGCSRLAFDEEGALKPKILH